MLQQLSDLFTTIGIPALGGLLFYDSRRRQAAAQAKQAEADARAKEEDTITAYAEQWKELFEREEKRCDEFKAEISALRAQLNDMQGKLYGLQANNAQLALDKERAEQWRCNVKHCQQRQPPNGL